jgi:L-ascorbate metabolism protein UlaG (beta-lactamase superfamily)
LSLAEKKRGVRLPTLVMPAARSAWRRYPRELARSVSEAWHGRPRFAHAPRAGLEAIHNLKTTDLGVVWLGHAGVLARLGDSIVLFDPVLSGRIGPRLGGRTVGLGRLTPAPLHPAQLPPVDVVLLSHAHFDHFDVPTLEAIASPRTTVVTARGTRGLVPAGFGRVVEVDWGQSVRLDGLELSAIRPEHWGARTALDRARGFNAYLVRSLSGRGRALFFGGDTAATEAFRGLRADVAVLGIGGYRPWEHAHATPEQAWRMFAGMRAERVLPVHHSTFRLSDEPTHEPLERFMSAAGREWCRVIDPVPGRGWVA